MTIDADMQEITLDRRQFARNGQGGQGGGSGGKNGEDLTLYVPVGTIVRELHKYYYDFIIIIVASPLLFFFIFCCFIIFILCIHFQF